MADDVFGQPIVKSDADELFRRFVEIKKRSAPKIKEALKDDPEALRYYCGREDKTSEGEDWAFVFDKKSLERIMASMELHQANGIFIFHGAEAASDKDVSGRPTLMIFPMEHVNVEMEHEVEFKLFNEFQRKGLAKEVDGEQHPGTGGGTLSYGETINLPDGFTKGQYQD